MNEKEIEKYADQTILCLFENFMDQEKIKLCCALSFLVMQLNHISNVCQIPKSEVDLTDTIGKIKYEIIKIICSEFDSTKITLIETLLENEEM